jgi:hypothetical protein
MTGVGSVAAWAGPALLVAVVARVTAGGVEAPLFVLVAVAAPMLALLAVPRSPRTPSGFAATAGLMTIVCVLGAGFRAVADLGHVLGLETGATLGAVVALVLVTTVWRDRDRVAASAFVLGAGAFLVAAVMLGATAARAPWTAWSRAASRGPFELGPRSEWTHEGVQFPRLITLSFGEPHRVTAVGAAVVRVTERDRVTAVHERTLAAGESLLLRPGDTLEIPPGTRLRFEAGRRVPGAPPSGVAWADGAGASRARLLAWWLGVTLTFGGGALMIVPAQADPSRASAILPPALVLALVLAAACWALYAVDAAPEASIGVSAAAVLVRLVPVLADDPWRSRILTAMSLALLALLLGSAAALRRSLVDLVAAPGAGAAEPLRRRVVEAATWVVMVVAALGAGMVAGDGLTLLGGGLGLAAAVVLGPGLVRGQGPAVEQARAKGALAGAVIFVVVAGLSRWLALAGAVDVIGRYPILLAAPGAWAAATLAKVAGARRD